MDDLASRGEKSSASRSDRRGFAEQRISSQAGVSAIDIVDRQHNQDSSALLMRTEIQGLKPPDTPTQYRAVGFLRAQYLPSADKFRQGTLVTDDGLFPAELNHDLANWLKKNPDQLEQPNLWMVYPRKSDSSPGLTFSARRLADESTSNANYFSIRGQLWGWDEEKGKLVMRIRRNEEPPPRLKHTPLWKPFYLEIQGRLPVEKKRGQFWEFKCFRDGESLLLEDGRMIEDAAEMKEIEDNPPILELKDISMTDARAEITLKFNTIPEVRELPKGRVEFYLKATNGVVFTVNIKGKSWRKAEASMKEFPSFVAMVGGKLGAPTSNGFELEGAGLQVFEKKPSEPKEPKELKSPKSEKAEAIATN